MIDALVLDFDGTILETEAVEYQAWAEIFAAHGAALDLHEWSACIGRRGGFDPYAVLARRASSPLPPPTDLRAAKAERVNELLAPIGPQPGVVAWIEDAVGRGLALAVASSSSVDWVDFHLQRLGLRHHFAFLACCGRSLPSKPDPTSYLSACSALGAEPRRSIAVEDSPNGARAAVDAGMYCVAVPTDMTRHLDLRHADVVVDSLRGFTLQDAIALAVASRPAVPLNG